MKKLTYIYRTQESELEKMYIWTGIDFSGESINLQLRIYWDYRFTHGNVNVAHIYKKNTKKRKRSPLVKKIITGSSQIK